MQTDYRYRQPLNNINFFSNDLQALQQSHKNLKSEYLMFVWQQLFIETLLRLKSKESNNNDELIDYLHQIYIKDNLQLKLIEEFKQTYKASESIRWYTRPGCLYIQLNEILRKMDFQLVILFRFFIKSK